jgi:hypothetical protein
VGVLWGSAMLPGQEGFYGIRGADPVDPKSLLPSAPTWADACPGGSADPLCLPDADADGWSDGSDCNDSSSLVNPGIADGLAWVIAGVTQSDWNCDGVPVESWDNL